MRQLGRINALSCRLGAMEVRLLPPMYHPDPSSGSNPSSWRPSRKSTKGSIVMLSQTAFAAQEAGQCRGKREARIQSATELVAAAVSSTLPAAKGHRAVPSRSAIEHSGDGRLQRHRTFVPPPSPIVRRTQTLRGVRPRRRRSFRLGNSPRRRRTSAVDTPNYRY